MLDNITPFTNISNNCLGAKVLKMLNFGPLKIWQIFRRAQEVKALNMSVTRVSGIPAAAESGISWKRKGKMIPIVIGGGILATVLVIFFVAVSVSVVVLTTGSAKNNTTMVPTTTAATTTTAPTTTTVPTTTAIQNPNRFWKI